MNNYRNTAMEYATRAAAGRENTDYVQSNPLEAGLDAGALEGYSFLKVFRAMADKTAIDGLEAEVSKTIAKRAGRDPKGVFVPTYALLMRHNAAAVTTSTGVGGIRTTVSSNYIDVLRPMTVMARAGATFLGGLQGTFSIPRSSGITAYWVTEGNGPTDGNVTVDQVKLAPKTIGARSDFTRAFINQTALSCEDLARDTILKTIAVGIDTAAIQGTGANGQPLGILNNTNCSYLNLATGASGAGTLGLNTATGSLLTLANVVALETLVTGANVNVDTGAFVLNPAVNGKLKTTPVVASTPIRFINEGGEIVGYKALASNIIPAANGTNSNAAPIIFGNWSDLMIGQWGALDLMVDPYALSTTGGVRIVGLQDVDVELRQPLAFARAYDARTY